MAAFADDRLIGLVKLRRKLVGSTTTMLVRQNLAHHTTVCLATGKAFKLFAAKLADDVSRAALDEGTLSPGAFQEGCHSIDLVLGQGVPRLAIDVAFLAVVMFGVLELVALHFLQRVEGLWTFTVSAGKPLAYHELKIRHVGGGGVAVVRETGEDGLLLL